MSKSLPNVEDNGHCRQRKCEVVGEAEMPDSADKLIYLKISRTEHRVWGWGTGNYGR